MEKTSVKTILNCFSLVSQQGEPTKRELLSTKSSLFVYPSRRLAISSPHEERRISSALWAVSHHAPACISLRLDDIQCFALMIYATMSQFHTRLRLDFYSISCMLEIHLQLQLTSRKILQYYCISIFYMIYFQYKIFN